MRVIAVGTSTCAKTFFGAVTSLFTTPLSNWAAAKLLRTNDDNLASIMSISLDLEARAYSFDLQEASLGQASVWSGNGAALRQPRLVEREATRSDAA